MNTSSDKHGAAFRDLMARLAPMYHVFSDENVAIAAFSMEQMAMAFRAGVESQRPSTLPPEAVVFQAETDRTVAGLRAMGEAVVNTIRQGQSAVSSISELRDLTAYIDELEKRAAEQKEWEKHPKCEDNGVGDTMQVIANELRDKFAVSARSETHRYVYIYPNGDYTAGRMEAIKLIPEIVYNVRMRPGRAIVVDGVAVYEGINVATDLIDSIISNLDGTTKP